jgi:hypothetical protein
MNGLKWQQGTMVMKKYRFSFSLLWVTGSLFDKGDPASFQCYLERVITLKQGTFNPILIVTGSIVMPLCGMSRDVSVEFLGGLGGSHLR